MLGPIVPHDKTHVFGKKGFQKRIVAACNGPLPVSKLRRIGVWFRFVVARLIELIPQALLRSVEKFNVPSDGFR
jgi:hypothetical protein